MGVAQHHDAISGTEKQNVADDYALRLAQGIDSAAVSISAHSSFHRTRHSRLRGMSFVWRRTRLLHLGCDQRGL